MFELGKTPNVDKKSFVLVVNEFWGYVGLNFEEYCWLVLVWMVWRSDYKKRNVWFSKEMLSIFFQNPCSCFGYRLSYNHQNEVIPIVKEP